MGKNEANSFEKKIRKILGRNKKFVDAEGNLIKSEIVNSASRFERDLIRPLLNDEETKHEFFDNIEIEEEGEECLIFNASKFTEYVRDKNVFSNSFTKFESKIGLNVDGKYLDERGEVSLVWPFKDCVLEGGMTKEEQKRDEIFFNEILAKDEIDRLFDPKVLIGFEKYGVAPPPLGK